MNDSISSFRIWAEGVSASGAVGVATALITSTNPFYMEYKLPIEATSGDELTIPVTLVNNLTNATTVTLAKKSSDNGELLEFLKTAKSSDFVPLEVCVDIFKYLNFQRDLLPLQKALDTG